MLFLCPLLLLVAIVTTGPRMWKKCTEIPWPRPRRLETFITKQRPADAAVLCILSFHAGIPRRIGRDGTG